VIARAYQRLCCRKENLMSGEGSGERKGKEAPLTSALEEFLRCSRSWAKKAIRGK